ncbi:MAG TPA: hypothetical protein VD994_18180 [Prosthecobacter sp.]|nr:hypothetical protein [Prosthecobacter sp.]
MPDGSRVAMDEEEEVRGFVDAVRADFPNSSLSQIEQAVRHVGKTMQGSQDRANLKERVREILSDNSWRD